MTGLQFEPFHSDNLLLPHSSKVTEQFDWPVVKDNQDDSMSSCVDIQSEPLPSHHVQILWSQAGSQLSKHLPLGFGNNQGHHKTVPARQ